ncbi:MAG: substrate-binding domain-containing protein [Opitutales bacterium]
MADFQVRSATEQVADYLRGEMLQGRWTGRLPGGTRLAEELGVGKSTMEAALTLLEAEGLLVPQGTGRARRIELGQVEGQRTCKIEILLYEKSDRKLDYLVELSYQLRQAGHAPRFSKKTLTDLGMDVARVARYVNEEEADLWVVVGASRTILEWFVGRPEPAYALFGRQMQVAISGSRVLNAATMVRAVRYLVALGHERIVLLTREERRKPTPGFFERCFLEALSDHGIQPGSFNLPDWEEVPGGLQRGLDALYAFTPPTALIISEPYLFLAAQQHLSLRGIVAPRDVSMLCCDWDPGFRAFQPPVAHFRWDSRVLIRQVMRWVNQAVKAKDSCRQALTEADFVKGGTIGTVPVRA